MSTVLTLLAFLSTHPAMVAHVAPARAYDAQSINAEIEQQAGFVRACYAAHPARPDGHGGKRLRLLFRLDGDGRVDAAIPEHDSLDNGAATACIRRIARTWQFPAPPTAGAQFEYSFRFR
jgi:hypothetical protein